MKLTKLVAAAFVGLALIIVPNIALAFPFGGAASIVIPCYNSAIYALVGPPVGGPFIWTPATLTFSFGPPSHSGQWILGNAGPPYFCLVSIDPIITYSGTDIIMMGSSQ
jgi:hypothetical protein